MYNLIKANFYKMRHMRSLWAVVVLSVGWVLLCAFMGDGRLADALWPDGVRIGFFPSNTFPYGGKQNSIIATVLCFNAFYWVSIILLVTQFWNRENNAASSRMAIAHGASKSQTVVSGFVAIALFGELLYLLCSLALLLIVCMGSGADFYGVLQNSAAYGGQGTLLVLGFISLSWFIASMIKNSSITTVFLFFFIIIGFIQSIAYGGSSANVTTEVLLSLNPMSYWLKLGALNVVTSTWLFSVLCVLVPLVGGSIFAQRRDLK